MKQSKFKFKIICGYRKEQEFTINANEAHKAYYLFNNPEKRGTFDNGLAIRGSDIQRIEPDYNATMGWNHTYQLTNDDWNELNSNGVADKLRTILASAKEIGKIGEPEDFKTPLIDLVKNKYPNQGARLGSSFAQKVLENKNKDIKIKCANCDSDTKFEESELQENGGFIISKDDVFCSEQCRIKIKKEKS